MDEKIINLIAAEKKARALFETIENAGLVKAGKSEQELNQEVYELASELFSIKKYWHKRIVRAGKNTLLPYKENPPDEIIKLNDILFFDFGPVFDEWEADLGRTYVVGNDARMLKLKNDVEAAWWEGKEYYEKNKNNLTGADFYSYTTEMALRFGWEYGNHHCGHLVGNFPHEILLGEEITNYIHPENKTLMSGPDSHGDERFWIYEIHFIDRQNQFGGFFEQLVSDI